MTDIADMNAGNLADESDTPADVIDFGVDLSTVDKPPLLPSRQYLAKVKAGATVVKTSEKSGKKYFQLTFNIAPENVPPDFICPDEGIDIARGFGSMIFRGTTQADLYKARKTIESLGLKPTSAMSCAFFDDAVATIEVGEEEDQDGEKINVVKRVLRP